ncbi:hypothetical protein [Roseiterribacter gracilis]|uniref:Uncharacterized protein n=1 Tax=Roseiterribacter gracilis TaxID=2812848 RepID=A0A8S8X8J7_9PROT|nr:hypothetical protein TMPK1_24550 [Rhodospirillales bacterium TMPK1]
MATAKKTTTAKPTMKVVSSKGPKLVRDEVMTAAPEIDKVAIRAPDPVEDLPGFVAVARLAKSLERGKLVQRLRTTAENWERYGAPALRGLRIGMAALHHRIDRVPPPALVDEIRGSRELPEAAQLGLYATERVAYALGVEGDSKEQLAKIQTQIDLLERRHRTI